MIIGLPHFLCVLLFCFVVFAGEEMAMADDVAPQTHDAESAQYAHSILSHENDKTHISYDEKVHASFMRGAGKLALICESGASTINPGAEQTVSVICRKDIAPTVSEHLSECDQEEVNILTSSFSKEDLNLLAMLINHQLPSELPQPTLERLKSIDQRFHSGVMDSISSADDACIKHLVYDYAYPKTVADLKALHLRVTQDLIMEPDFAAHSETQK